jgi:hypothetical protein
MFLKHVLQPLCACALDTGIKSPVSSLLGFDSINYAGDAVSLINADKQIDYYSDKSKHIFCWFEQGGYLQS